jgi:hypothetical protein
MPTTPFFYSIFNKLVVISINKVNHAHASIERPSSDFERRPWTIDPTSALHAAFIGLCSWNSAAL